MPPSTPHTQSPSFWRKYRFELIWLIAVLIGLFLLFERVAIGPTLKRWLAAFSHSISSGLNSIIGSIVYRIDHLTGSDLLGLILVVIAVIVIGIRVRWRLLHDPAFTVRVCPRCGSEISRVHRHRSDRWFNHLVPVRRYMCRNSECRWSGLRFGHSAQDRRKSAQKT